MKNKDRKAKKDTEREFCDFLWDKNSEVHEDQETDLGDTDEEIFPLRYREMRRRMPRRRGWRGNRLTPWEVHQKVLSEMIEDPEKKISKLLDSFNDITKETSQLIEIKDIIDELKMIFEVQEEQMRVLDDFVTALPDLSLKKVSKIAVEPVGKSDENQHTVLKDETQKENSKQVVEGEKTQPSGNTIMWKRVIMGMRIEDMEQFVKSGKERCLEITALSNKAKETMKAVITRRRSSPVGASHFQQIDQLLELKQKQANASEARTTRMQAEQSEKQGKVVLYHTHGYKSHSHSHALLYRLSWYSQLSLLYL